MSTATSVGRRGMRVGPGSLRGLEWLVRVGPSGIDAWAAAMGWSRQTAFDHAKRLEIERWLARFPTVRGEGSLLTVTRLGVQMSGLNLTAPAAPAPTWWAHLHGCAWAAAWLTARGRLMQGPREVTGDGSWVGEIRWRDTRGQRKVGHRPDLAWLVDGRRVAVEVELARKSSPRLEAILALHGRWRASGQTGGVIYICGDQAAAERVMRVGVRHGLGTGRGEGLRVELLARVREQACQARLGRTDGERAGGG